MSEHTLGYLRKNVLAGFCANRGNAWHAAMSENGELPFNHWDGPVPWQAVRSLFDFEAQRANVARVVDGKVQYSPEGDIQLIEDMIELYHSKTGRSFGTFSESYQEHQFHDVLLGMVSEIVSDTLQIGTAGLLKFGAVAWVQVELPETIELPQIGEAFRPSLLAASSHDGSIANTFKRVIKRVVCDNTLTAGLNETGSTFKFRHSKNSKENREEKVSAAREAADIIELLAGEYEAEAMAMCQREISDAQWTKFVELSFPLKENAAKQAQTMRDEKIAVMDDLWDNDPRVSPWRGTYWGALQAASTYKQHLTTLRKVGDREVSRVERNFESMVFGGFAKDDAKAIELLEKALVLA